MKIAEIKEMPTNDLVERVEADRVGTYPTRNFATLGPL